MKRLRYDTLVVGSGIAGLFTALKAAEHGSVVVVTKAALEESNTRYAQGGIAAALADDDSAQLHIRDTLAAGAGLCRADAVKDLCEDGPMRVRELIELGVEFDRDAQGLARGLEAAHSRSRILHAGGDATGAFIERGLVGALPHANVAVLEGTFLVDLVVRSGVVCGADFVTREGLSLSIEASTVVLATGGAGQVFRHTTNPLVATGDGFAAAIRAGAVVSDAEFYQFHPTALAVPGSFLISEAVRGEGAVLRDAHGKRFMLDVHPDAELAPRDVVARAIADQMAEQDGAPVVLDATALGGEFLARRFPSIHERCLQLGLDWTREPIPVTPAAHYWMGGVRTDVDGRTSLPGLFAAGEVANTGVHGANRLASNSLLEGLVFGARTAAAIGMGAVGAPSFGNAQTVDISSSPFITRSDVQGTMWDNAGLCRTADSLKIAMKTLTNGKALETASSTLPTTLSQLEDRNLATAAIVITAGAMVRTESRGAHYRSDYAQTDDQWRRSLNFVAQ